MSTVKLIQDDEEIVLKLFTNVQASVTMFFRALADETRVKIIYALLLEPDLCVCDIAQISNLTISGASHHLRLLKAMGLARSRKEGKLVRYSIHDEHVKIILEKALDHSNHLST